MTVHLIPTSSPIGAGCGSSDISIGLGSSVAAEYVQNIQYRVNTILIFLIRDTDYVVEYLYIHVYTYILLLLYYLLTILCAYKCNVICLVLYIIQSM